MGKRRHNARRADDLGSIAPVVGSGEQIADKVFFVDVLSSQLSAPPLIFRDEFLVALLGAEFLEVDDVIIDALAADDVDAWSVAVAGRVQLRFLEIVLQVLARQGDVSMARLG